MTAHTVTARRSGTALPAGKQLVGVVVVAVLTLLPLLVPTFTLSVATQILAFAVLAGSLHLLLGWAGIPSLGQAAYFGVAAYAVGIAASHVTDSAPVLLLVGALAGGVAAALTGWILARSAGGYLLMITIAVGELLAHAAVSWSSVTGGDNGMAAIPFTTVGPVVLFEPSAIYWFALVVFLLAFGALGLVGRSSYGRVLRGIANNEARMRSLGYATHVHKYAAFCLAGALAGVGGAVWVAQTQFVSPTDLTIQHSSMVLLAVIVGGSRSLWGPLLGSALVIVAQNLLPDSLEGTGMLVLGLILIVAVYVLPEGLTGLPAQLRRRS